MARVLVLGAAGPAGMNYSRAIREAGHQVIPADTDSMRLEGWYPDEPGLLLDPGPLTIRSLEAMCSALTVDVIHSQPEEYLAQLARLRPDFVGHLLPPDHDVQMTQDKWENALRWRRTGLRQDYCTKVETTDMLHEAADWLGYPYWLRATRGAGARGATLVENHDMAHHWISYWDSRGVDWEWIAEEYLPGRDFAWTSIWFEGDLVCSTARERLQYIYPHLAPSGRTGTPVAARIVHSEAVNTMAFEAVMAVSQRPHGTYCVDLREDEQGTPRPTEINCGRFFTTSYHTAAMGVNFPDIHVRLALGEPPPDVPQYDALPDGLVWLRHIDCPGVVIGDSYTRSPVLQERAGNV